MSVRSLIGYHFKDEIHTCKKIIMPFCGMCGFFHYLDLKQAKINRKWMISHEPRVTQQQKLH